jgi:hypothetical protein
VRQGTAPGVLCDRGAARERYSVDGHTVRLEVHDVARQGTDALEDRLDPARAGTPGQVAALAREPSSGRGDAGDHEPSALEGLVHPAVEAEGGARGDVEAEPRAEEEDG